MDGAAALATTPARLGWLSFFALVFAVDWLDSEPAPATDSPLLDCTVARAPDDAEVEVTAGDVAELLFAPVFEALAGGAAPADSTIACHSGPKVIARAATSGNALIRQRLRPGSCATMTAAVPEISFRRQEPAYN